MLKIILRRNSMSLFKHLKAIFQNLPTCFTIPEISGEVEAEMALTDELEEAARRTNLDPQFVRRCYDHWTKRGVMPPNQIFLGKRQDFLDRLESVAAQPRPQ
jgi:hypothetical protein